MKKHIQTSLSWLLALTMMVTMLPTYALAADADAVSDTGKIVVTSADDLPEYESYSAVMAATEEEQTITAVQYAAAATSGTCGGNLTWTLEDGVLTVSGSGAMKESLFGIDGLITSVVISDGVTSIADYSFLYATGLTSVTLPDSLTSIGAGAFCYCTDLTSITIPNSVTSIGDNAFDDCSSLTSITIPKSMTSIGNSVFSGCSGLTSITIPSNITSIGDGAFLGCTGLTSITIPNSVTSIGNSAFLGCTGLTSITIPDSVTTISEQAFAYCRGLTSITIPNSVTSIGDYAFYECNELKSIVIPASVTEIGEEALGYRYDDSSYEDVRISGFTIYGKTGTAAETYATENEFTFISPCTDDHIWDEGTVTKAATSTEKGVKTYTCTVCRETKTEDIDANSSAESSGDINGDGKVDTNDLVRLMKKISENAQNTSLDINGDGKVDTNDLIRLMKYLTDNTVEIH
jgi:hypothetical protein